MKLYSLRNSIIALLTILLFSTIGLASAEAQFEVESITIKVYRDGLTHITQTLNVDELLPDIALPLLSANVEDLIILDENQLVVDHEQNAENLTVFTLGAARVTIEYDTIALTNKKADVWTLILNTPYNSTVSLPNNSTIVFLSNVPTRIDTLDTELTLHLQPGQWEISYILPFQPQDQNGVTPQAGVPTEVLIATIIIAVVTTLTVAIFVFRRKRKVNVKKILSRNPNLMKEDIAVIEFLAEKDGKAFETEIRERFPDMPRTSLWRLVKRLEGLDIVEVRRIGLQNQVRIRK